MIVVVAVVTVLAAPGCFLGLPAPDLAGYACQRQSDCIAGFVCEQRVCVVAEGEGEIGDVDPDPTWVARFDCGGVSSFSDAAVAADGSVVVVGNCAGTLNVGGDEFVGAGGDDFFVVIFEANGALRHAQAYGAAGNDSAEAVATIDDDVFVAGHYEQAVDFDPTAAGGERFNAGQGDGFILHLDTAGTFLSITTVVTNGSGSATLRSIALVDDDSYLVGGDFSGSVALALDNNVERVAGSNGGSFLIRFDDIVTEVWQRIYDSAGVAEHVVVDANADVYAGGSFAGTIDVDFAGDTRQAVDLRDAVLVALNDAGVPRFAQTWGFSGRTESVRGLAFDGATLVVASVVDDDITLNDGLPEEFDVFFSNQTFATFIAELNPETGVFSESLRFKTINAAVVDLAIDDDVVGISGSANVAADLDVSGAEVFPAADGAAYVVAFAGRTQRRLSQATGGPLIAGPVVVSGGDVYGGVICAGDCDVGFGGPAIAVTPTPPVRTLAFARLPLR